MIRVYVAGAWVEQNYRAKPMIAAIKARSIVCTHDWTAAEGAIHGSSDADLTHVQRRQFAEEDLKGIRGADVLWLLAPEAKGSCGAWVELGYALAMREFYRGFNLPEFRDDSTRVIVSGPKNKRSIFTELTDRLFDTDEEALQWLEDLSKEEAT